MKKYKPPKEKLSTKMRVLRIIFYVLMIIITLLFLLPFWGTITTSLKNSTDAMTTNALLFTSDVEVTFKNLPEGKAITDLFDYENPKNGRHKYYATEVDPENLPEGVEEDDVFFDEAGGKYYADEVKVRNLPDGAALSDIVYDEESGKYYCRTRISLESYGNAFEELKGSLLNSFIITIFGALGSCFLGSICAYAISKYRFKFDGVFFLALSAAIYLPYQAILVPLLRTMNDLSLYDTHIGLILIHSIYGMPMCMSMFRGFYSEVPDALVKQAMIDGNGPWRIYRKIILPNTTIASVTVLVFQCTSVWNEMLFALTMTQVDAKPATIALNEMVSSLSADFSIQMAGSIWLTLPILILYLFMGKYLIRGYMAGAVTAS